MRYDHLAETISEDEPCGPDLDEIGDDTYLNYVLPASDRLPDRFYDQETEAPFDRASVDLKGEVKTIGELLERTRDLRLLALEARFQCLAGQPIGFCECLQAMAALIEQRWEDVHPKAFDGDFTLRQNTLAALDDRSTIILPLEYAPLVNDRRVGAVSLRQHLVANGDVQAREKETTTDLPTILEALQIEDHRAAIEATHAAVLAGEQALTAIREKFQDAAGYEYAPSFDGLQEVLGRLRIFIEAALPDLAAAPSDEAGAESAADGPEGDTGEAAASPAGEAATATPVAATPIANHAAAAAALLAVEQYYSRNEPSSPSLILVHQARILVGKPLVVALDTLLPETAERAQISLDVHMGFQLTMPRMRSLTEAATNGAAGADEDPPPQFAAQTRPEAEGLIQGVEAFFRRTEPSSPIPMLLARAKTLMNRDFSAILAEIVKKNSENQAT